MLPVKFVSLVLSLARMTGDTVAPSGKSSYPVFISVTNIKGMGILRIDSNVDRT